MYYFIFILILLLLIFPIPAAIVSFFGMGYFNKKSAYMFMFIFVLGISLLALYYSPSAADDFYRYQQNMRIMRTTTGLSNLFSLINSNTSLNYQSDSILFNILEYFIAKTGRFTLLPYFSTVITYGSILFPLVDLKVHGYISKTMFFLLSAQILLLFSLFFTFNTMRWAMACALFFLILYIYNKTQLKRYLYLFIIPILFHVGIILAVALTIYFYFIKKVNLKTVLPALLGLIVYLSIAKFFTGTGILARIAQMATGYSTDFMQRNTNGLIIVFLHRLATVLIISSAAIFIYRKKGIKIKLDRILIVFTICLILLSGSMIQNRYLLVVSLIAILSIGINYLNSKTAITQLDVGLLFIIAMISISASAVIVYADVKDMEFSRPIIEVFFSSIFSLLKNIPTYY
ncbi:hypothetical protein [Loigolactobacillus zhaoyuanensis]|uniref:hypothetical protein n=1 Tax=Loigolactobacillus zhaoyuanensis TaxID=2486017 RepID=UPI000F74BB79|nr:hypothetical protein [Loigolactobacillus zhaoyuanensis]